MTAQNQAGEAIDLELLLLPLGVRRPSFARAIGVLAPLKVPAWLGATPIGAMTLGGRRHFIGAELEKRLLPRFMASRGRRAPEAFPTVAGRTRPIPRTRADRQRGSRVHKTTTRMDRKAPPKTSGVVAITRPTAGGAQRAVNTARLRLSPRSMWAEMAVPEPKAALRSLTDEETGASGACASTCWAATCCAGPGVNFPCQVVDMSPGDAHGVDRTGCRPAGRTHVIGAYRRSIWAAWKEAISRGFSKTASP